MTEQTPQHEDNVYDSNPSGNPEFRSLFDQKISRRNLITKSAGGAVALTLATTLVGCGSDDNDNVTGTLPPEVDKQPLPKALTFKPVEKNTLNAFTVPEGYEARVLFALGDPINTAYAE